MLGARSPRSKCQQGWFLSLFPPCVVIWSWLCVSVSTFPLLIKTHILDQGPPAWPHLTLPPLSTFSHLLGYCGLGLQHEFGDGGHNSAPNKRLNKNLIKVLGCFCDSRSMTFNPLLRFLETVKLTGRDSDPRVQDRI